MSQRSSSRQSRVSRVNQAQEEIQKRINYESPSKYDLDFYQRKVNRLQNDLAQLQDELGLARFRLHKAEDFQIKYELLLKQNQGLTADNQKLIKDLTARTRELEDFRNRLGSEESKKLQTEGELRKATSEIIQLKRRLDQNKQRGRSQVQQQKTKIHNQFNRQIDHLRGEHLDIQRKLQAEINQLKDFIASKQTSEQTNAFRLEKLRADKNGEIDRLNELVNALKSENTRLRESTNDKVLKFRDELNKQNYERVQQISKISQTTQTLLMKEVQTLRATINSKNSQIQALLLYQQEFLKQYTSQTNDLKSQIKHLQDKIFQIHRINELALFDALDKLKAQYERDFKATRDQFKRIENQYEQRIRDLNLHIDKLKEQIGILNSNLRSAQASHIKHSKDKQALISTLSQKILKMEEHKDEQAKNMRTSMKLIEEEAETKLKDLHDAMANKHEEFEIMKAQLALKNKQIAHLLDQMHKMRIQNRQRIGKLQDIYTKQVEQVKAQLARAQKSIHDLKRQNHELKDDMEDQRKQFKLQLQLKAQDANQLKDANEKLIKKNEMIREYVKELEDDLKVERGRNVDFVQDTNTVRREVIQEREKVRGQLEAQKAKEIEQMRNIFSIDLNKLKTQNANLAHKLRDKTDHYNKLLNEFKDLEAKVASLTRTSQNKAEDQARKKATLECQIHLTRNISNAISKGT